MMFTHKYVVISTHDRLCYDHGDWCGFDDKHKAIDKASRVEGFVYELTRIIEGNKIKYEVGNIPLNHRYEEV